jgi:hypothetical protein
MAHLMGVAERKRNNEMLLDEISNVHVAPFTFLFYVYNFMYIAAIVLGHAL